VAAATRESLISKSESPTSVTVVGTTDRAGWLGLSAYPAGAGGKSYHTVVFVPQGRWQERLALAGSFAGGSYEVALWEQKVPRSSCRTAGCKWCPINGYHMDGLRSYSSGKVGR
jgi:hypothetical protein